jgi:hypothetical protein
MSLVTPTQMAALRKLAYRGLETPFEVWRTTRTESVYGTASAQTKVSEGIGWLRMMNRPHLSEQAGMREGATSVYRLHTTPDVDVEVGDEIRVSGTDGYIVQDTNFDDTIQVFRTCVLRRISP